MIFYLAAIPFLPKTLAGDLFYSTSLFGGFALLERGISGATRSAAAPFVGTKA